MNSAEVSTIISRLSDKYNLSEAVIRKIVLSQFVFLKETITDNDIATNKYNNVRLRNLGIFYVSDRRKHFNTKRTKMKKHEEDLRSARGEEQSEDGR